MFIESLFNNNIFIGRILKDSPYPVVRKWDNQISIYPSEKNVFAGVVFLGLCKSENNSIFVIPTPPITQSVIILSRGEMLENKFGWLWLFT